MEALSLQASEKYSLTGDPIFDGLSSKADTNTLGKAKLLLDMFVNNLFKLVSYLGGSVFLAAFRALQLYLFFHFNILH